MAPKNESDIKDLKSLAKKIKDSWSFMDSYFQNAECEAICVQTLQASVKNYKTHGRAFSFEGDGVRDGRRVDGTDNASAFDRLIREGFIVEGAFNGKPTLTMTRKLIDLMKGYLAQS